MRDKNRWNVLGQVNFFLHNASTLLQSLLTLFYFIIYCYQQN